MRALGRATLFAAGILVATSTHAQGVPSGPPAAPGAPWRDDSIHRHRGLLLRPDLGFGYMAISEPTSQGDLKLSGVAAFFGVAIGGAVSEDVAVAFHLYDGVISNPTATLAGQATSTSGTTAVMVGFGPELTYYFTPSNVYLSATLAVTRLSLEVNGTKADSNYGFGAQLGVGKEWWVSDHWGLGLVGRLSLSSNEDQGTNAPTLSTWGLGLAFSATYN